MYRYCANSQLPSHVCEDWVGLKVLCTQCTSKLSSVDKMSAHQNRPCCENKTHIHRHLLKKEGKTHLLPRPTSIPKPAAKSVSIVQHIGNPCSRLFIVKVLTMVSEFFQGKN